MPAPSDQLDEAFRQAMRRVASTVNVITICVDGRPMGITATAMSSLAMNPPSLLVCINQTASLHASIRDVTHFGVNVLHRDQQHLAQMFADRSKAELRFASGWELDCAHPPRLADAQASLLCRRIDHHQFGTHSIFIGVVEEVRVRGEVDPLIYLDGSYAGARSERVEV
ncbi:MAG TPA: flavin reductase family protein [Allosphingosinicella sp.]|jgi:flavin reductase (DIM6/NTAB) family NADH-FMN oxidoreductase RutF|uniref:flavin reductase family protein n=1 Tax=Allosphingosinicella sp. TaxID=2823234 RepID=UPI002F2A4589